MIDDNLSPIFWSFSKYFSNLGQDDNLWQAKVEKTYDAEAHFTFPQQYLDLKKRSVIIKFGLVSRLSMKETYPY